MLRTHMPNRLTLQIGRVLPSPVCQLKFYNQILQTKRKLNVRVIDPRFLSSLSTGAGLSLAIFLLATST